MTTIAVTSIAISWGHLWGSIFGCYRAVFNWDLRYSRKGYVSLLFVHQAFLVWCRSHHHHVCATPWLLLLFTFNNPSSLFVHRLNPLKNKNDLYSIIECDTIGSPAPETIWHQSMKRDTRVRLCNLFAFLFRKKKYLKKKAVSPRSYSACWQLHIHVYFVHIYEYMYAEI